MDAALLILERMGLSPDDLTAAPRQRPSVPTFADYVPVVSATVTSGTRKAYGSYWNRVVEQWAPGAWTSRHPRDRLSGLLDRRDVRAGKTHVKLADLDGCRPGRAGGQAVSSSD